MEKKLYAHPSMRVATLRTPRLCQSTTVYLSRGHYDDDTNKPTEETYNGNTGFHSDSKSMGGFSDESIEW